MGTYFDAWLGVQTALCCAFLFHFLEPGLKALVKHPVLLFELHGRQILLISLLLVVEGKEESLMVKASEVGRVGIQRYGGVRVLGPHANGLLRVDHFLVFGLGLISKRNSQEVARAQQSLLLLHLVRFGGGY